MSKRGTLRDAEPQRTPTRERANRRGPRLFADYQPGASRGERLDARSGLRVREARVDDAAELGRLSAARDGGDPSERADGFVRAMRASSARRDRIWVADVADEPIAYGKIHYFVPAAGSPPNAAPEGWYLAGMIVDPAFRRRGVGRILTTERLLWIASHSTSAYYFVNALNRASIDLHAAFGFIELTRSFWYPGATFTGGPGILFRRDTAASARPV